MTRLAAKSPCDGLLPLKVADLILSEESLGMLTSVVPFKGQAAALSRALQAAHGVAFPAVGRADFGEAGSCALWFGQDLALLAGPVPDAALARHAALADQSDAWAVVRLTGARSAEVLARLTPLDLRESAFAIGNSMRTELAHMPASLTRMDENAFRIMVFRSFAQTLVDEVKTAMQGVAARHSL